MIARIARFCTRQYFAVLALLRASHHSRFRIAIRNTYRQWLQHEFHAHTTMRFERLFKGARIYESRNNKMYLALCHPSDI